MQGEDKIKEEDKVVIILLAEGFEEIEALATVDILRRCAIDVKMASTEKNIDVVGSHNISVKADLLLDEVLSEDVEAVILPGGMPGTNNLQASSSVNKLFMDAYEKGKLVAAICAAPKVFGAAGILKGRKATCFPGFEDELLGAELAKGKVAVDGNVITSKGAGTAHDFAFEIAKWLGKKEEAEKVRASMQYDA
jgi:4-methyl-5(b-hydroxyethyl)-thiazole monophosphate biosynthesis